MPFITQQRSSLMTSIAPPAIDIAPPAQINKAPRNGLSNEKLLSKITALLI
jgi:hypothetical protein